MCDPCFDKMIILCSFRKIICAATCESEKSMGLYVHSLDNIPEAARRGYFIYLLDYGWKEPLGEALMSNYAKMAEISAQNNAVVIKGTSAHFQDEVFSWHHINGEDAENILPAILIANRHPKKFHEFYSDRSREDVESDLKLILVPLRKVCKTTTDVIDMINKIFSDIQQQKDLSDFRVKKEMKRGVSQAIADAVILEPNISGVGFNFKRFFQSLSGR